MSGMCGTQFLHLSGEKIPKVYLRARDIDAQAEPRSVEVEQIVQERFASERRC